MANNYCTVCPTNCATALILPVLDVSQSCNLASTVYKSQIYDLVLLPSTAALPAAMTAVGFLPIIDNTDVAGTKAKHLAVRGGIAAPARTEQDVARGQKVTTKLLYTATLTVDNLSDTNYTFLRALQCGSTAFKMWYTTESHIFGDVNGIEPESIGVEFIYDAGKDSNTSANIIVTWDAQCDPPRAANPIP